jgi:hypothetical protein
MLFFVGTRFHRYTVNALQDSLCGGHGIWTVPLTYDDLFAAELFPGGTYVFTDIERLSAQERLLAAEIHRAMAAHPDIFRLINDPARVRLRYGLLRALYESGLNAFDAYRADGLPRPRRFPVFIKAQSNHAPALSDLLPDQPALDAALAQLEAAGQPLDGLVVIEFCAQPIRPEIWTRYTAFAVDGSILLDLPVTESHWMVKDGTAGLAQEADYRDHDDMIRSNRHAADLRSAFEIARIGFGRADFGLVDGRPQIYEINTNPHFIGLEGRYPDPIRQATRAFAFARLAAHLAALVDPAALRETVALDLPLIRHHRLASANAPMGWRP